MEGEKRLAQAMAKAGKSWRESKWRIGCVSYRNFERVNITRLSFLDKGRQAWGDEFWNVDDRHPQGIHHAGMTHDPYIIVMAGLLPAALYAMKLWPHQSQSTHPVHKVASPLRLHLAARLLTVRSLK